MSDIDKVLDYLARDGYGTPIGVLESVAPARAELAALRRRAQGVDVEAVVREVRAAIAAWTHPGMSDHDRSVVVEQALRRALARETGGV